jgi:serine/threonine protein kinase
MTVLYAPPEAINGDEHGRSADIFSLGLVMSEMLEYIFYPWGPSSVERRLREKEDGKRESSSFNPAPMTRDEEDFLQYMPRAEREIPQEDMQLLFKVMTARDPRKRPTAKDVWAFLKGRHLDLAFGDGGVCSTYGKCCT